MKIATWNINGIKARIDAATTWLKSASPDIACLQEIKCADEAFPKEAFEDLGYNVAVHGQKGFNGVALLSKLPFDDITPRLAGDPDDVQARYLEACVSGSVRGASPAQYLSAERQSAGLRKICLQARLDDAAQRSHQGAARQ
jgi:exodeoxyribonuclease-3